MCKCTKINLSSAVFIDEWRATLDETEGRPKYCILPGNSQLKQSQGIWIIILRVESVHI